MFYSKLDSAGHLTYANAGHCAPMLVRMSGEIEKLEATSMPVGLVPERHSVSSHGTCTRATASFLYTDGVTEAQNEAGEFFGRKRLREAVQRQAARIAPRFTRRCSGLCSISLPEPNKQTTSRSWWLNTAAPMNQQ